MVSPAAEIAPPPTLQENACGLAMGFSSQQPVVGAAAEQGQQAVNGREEEREEEQQP